MTTMKTHNTAFTEAYCAVQRGAHVIVSDAFMDWLDENYPDHNVKTGLNRNPIGTLDRLVAFIGKAPADSEYTPRGMLMSGMYMGATRGHDIIGD